MPRRRGSRLAGASGAWRGFHPLAEEPSNVWKQAQTVEEISHGEMWVHRHTRLDKHTYLNRSDLEALSIRKMKRPTSVFKEKETTLSSMTTKPWEGESGFYMNLVIQTCWSTHLHTSQHVFVLTYAKCSWTLHCVAYVTVTCCLQNRTSTCVMVWEHPTHSEIVMSKKKKFGNLPSFLIWNGLYIDSTEMLGLQMLSKYIIAKL